MSTAVLQMPGHAGTGVTRVCVIGDIDLASAPLLDDALAMATAHGDGDIHLDLSEVTFFDCAALRALEHADGATPGKLRLVAASEPVHLLLNSLDLQHRFTAA